MRFIPFCLAGLFALSIGKASAVDVVVQVPPPEVVYRPLEKVVVVRPAYPEPVYYPAPAPYPPPVYYPAPHGHGHDQGYWHEECEFDDKGKHKHKHKHKKYGKHDD